MNYEIKHTVHAGRSDQIERWLEGALIVDPEYPDSMVSSIYFDTFSLSAFNEKLDGDYLKTKYRIRWYASGTGAGGHNPVAQVKRAVGSRRIKRTAPLDIEPSELARTPLSSPKLIEYRKLFHDLARPAESALLPTILITYRRKRYLETRNNLLVCIDSSIEYSADSIVLRCPERGVLRDTVVEVKGSVCDLPPELQPLISMGCRKTSYSKYASCIQKAIT